MLEIATSRKNKICLLDYDYQNDIENRVLLATFSKFELEILEELLFSSIKTSKSRLSKDLNIEKNDLLPVLEKLEKIKLLKIDEDSIIIDKKMRKYFEFEYMRFDENFKPDLQFINNLLQKIPIHILPIWYTIPKSSNNIFNSIIDKFLISPQVFLRYLEDLEHENHIFLGIIQDLYNSDNFELKSDDLQKKYDLDKAKYLEYILLLEFNFVCFQSYKETKEGYEEIITPFYEYKEYLQFLKKTKAPSIRDKNKLIKKRNSDFGFVEDISSILQMSNKGLSLNEIKQNIKEEINIKDPDILVTLTYIDSLIDKLDQLKFVEKKNNFLKITDSGSKWAKLNLEHRALHLYYHSLNSLKDNNLPNELKNEKSIREAEKTISRVTKTGWVYFDDFIKGSICALRDEQQIKIKPIGKVYRYAMPIYTEEERVFIKKIIFEKLFEAGIVSVGSLNAKDCFCVTKFGQTLFDVT